jgi:hypothetical protein
MAVALVDTALTATVFIASSKTTDGAGGVTAVASNDGSTGARTGAGKGDDKGAGTTAV